MTDLSDLGERVQQERRGQRYSVSSAARAAQIARDTWRKIEAGQSVHDTNRQAALDLLGLDWWGYPKRDDAPPPSAPEDVTLADATEDQLIEALVALRAAKSHPNDAVTEAGA